MDPRISVNEVTDLTHLQGKSSVFEWFLHLSGAEHSQVSTISSRATLTVFRCNPLEVFLILDFVLELLDICHGLILRTSNWFVPV